MKVVLVMLVVTAVLLIYQTTSPVRITENMIFSYKHKMLLGEAETVASSLSSSQNLTSQGAEEIMSVLGTRDMGQVKSARKFSANRDSGAVKCGGTS